MIRNHIITKSKIQFWGLIYKKKTNLRKNPKFSISFSLVDCKL